MATTQRANVALALSTAVVWGVILLVPDALYWDDWVIVGGDVVALFDEVGAPWDGYFFSAVSSVGMVGFKIIAVACAVVIALAARGIASQGLGLDPTLTFLAAAFVALLPFNVARASAAVLCTYSISLAMFFIAWWLLVAPGRVRRMRSWSAAGLLLLSFVDTPSLLVFVAAPVAHLALLELDRSHGFWRGLPRFVLRYWYVLATPLVFWSIRIAFLQPSGLYADTYNRFAGWSWPPRATDIATGLMLATLVAGILLLLPRIFRPPSYRLDVATCLIGGSWVVGIAVLLWLGRGSTSPGAAVIPLLLALAGATVVVMSVAASRGGAVHEHVGRAGFLTATGLVVFALGALPYLLVGKVPNFTDWETRHQMLLPVGSALFLLAAIVALEGAGRAAAARAAGYVAVVVSAVAVVISGLTLIADWHKQEQVIAALSTLDEVRQASTVVVTDETVPWNYGARHLRFYEPTGWLHEAFGDRSRFALDSADAQTRRVADLYDEGLRYGFPDWNSDGPVIGIVIGPVDGASWWELLAGRQAIDVTPTSTPFDPGHFRQSEPE